jgi:hypothetical protein
MRIEEIYKGLRFIEGVVSCQAPGNTFEKIAEILERGK